MRIYEKVGNTSANHPVGKPFGDIAFSRPACPADLDSGPHIIVGHKGFDGVAECFLTEAADEISAMVIEHKKSWLRSLLTFRRVTQRKNSFPESGLFRFDKLLFGLRIDASQTAESADTAFVRLPQLSQLLIK